MAAGSNTRPRNISLGPEAQARLEALKAKAGASSASEVIRDALRYYEFLINETVAGTEFYFKRTTDKENTKLHFI